MTLKLYGRGASTCTKRVLVTLAEKNVEDFKLEVIDLANKQHKTPDFLAKQPFGQIPVLEDGDLTLFESRAIARYIAEKYTGQGTELLSDSLQSRALIYTWLEVETNNLNPPLQSIIKELVIKPRYGQPPDAQAAAQSVEKLKGVLDVYERHLSSNNYLAGDSFSLADLVHLPYLDVLPSSGHGGLITSRPAVNAWWERISSRPSWQKVRAAA